MKELTQKVKLEGIAEKQNWLSECDQEKITKIILKKKPKKSDDKGVCVVTIGMLIKKLIKFQGRCIERKAIISDKIHSSHFKQLCCHNGLWIC